MIKKSLRAYITGSNWVFFPDPNWLCAPGANMSSLIGGENDGYERFHEFIDYDNTPENQAIEEMVFQSLHNVLELLPPKDYELIYELYFKNHTERECAQRLGMSQQAIHERKKRILKKIKNNLDEEGC